MTTAWGVTFEDLEKIGVDVKTPDFTEEQRIRFVNEVKKDMKALVEGCVEIDLREGPAYNSEEGVWERSRCVCAVGAVCLNRNPPFHGSFRPTYGQHIDPGPLSAAIALGLPAIPINIIYGDIMDMLLFDEEHNNMLLESVRDIAPQAAIAMAELYQYYLDIEEP